MICQNVDFTKESDTTFLFTTNRISRLFEIPKIENQRNQYVFRLYTNIALIELSNNGKIESSITFFVENNDGNKREKFKKTYTIPEETSNLLFQYIRNNSINDIPSCNLIPKWKENHYCRYDIFDIIKPEKRSLKGYCDLESQKLNEAGRVLDFIKYLKLIINYQKYESEFHTQVPFISYRYYYGRTTITKILDKKTMRKRKRQLKKNKR